MKKIIFLLLICSSAYSASFDCAKASSETGKAICNNSILSNLDEQVSQSYKAGFSISTDKEKFYFRHSAWRKEISRCAADEVCIEKSLRKRISELSPATATDLDFSSTAKKSPNFVIMTKTEDTESYYDANSIIKNDNFSQITTGINYIKGGKFDDIDAIVFSLLTVSHFDCVGKKGRISEGSFFSGKSATGKLIKNQKSNDSFNDISKNPNLMKILQIACK